MTDLPDMTMHEKRALYYIRDVNQNLSQEEPANIATLSEESDWDSKYFTRAWKKLRPKGLVNKKSDGKYTRLECTDAGEKVVSLYLEINEVLP
jgi:predicted transcriptional regulator